jgi:hypothetical protein
MLTMTPLLSCLREMGMHRRIRYMGPVTLMGNTRSPYGIADFANGLSAVHDASTVDKDIDVTPFVHDRVGDGIDLVFVGDVALDVYLVLGSIMFSIVLADVQDGDCCALTLEQ